MRIFKNHKKDEMFYDENNPFLENGSLSVHSFSEHYFSIPQYTGGWENRFRFQETYICMVHF